MNNYKSLKNKIFQKKIILDKLKKLQNQSFLIIDIFTIFISLYTFFIINVSNISKLKVFLLTSFITLLSFLFYLLNENYKLINLYFNSRYFYKIVINNSFLFLITIVFNTLININKFEILKCWILISGLMGLSRLIYRDLYNFINKKYRVSVLDTIIYGAGEAGAMLSSNILKDNKYKIKFFVDDNPNIWGREINGIKIYSPDEIFRISDSNTKIFLAIPSLTKKKLRQINNKVRESNLELLRVPSIDEINEQKVSIDQVRSIKIEELLGRDCVKPNKELLKNSIYNKTICITGGAGSIGSELCRVIIDYNPRKLIVIDNSEIGLYELNCSLNKLNKKIDISYFLEDVTNVNSLKNIFSRENIDSIYHAAAYKHVYIVEKNPLSGLRNNVFSTLLLSELAIEYQVSNFILISSDKAVRPTNIMGVSKRISELIVQAFSQAKNNTSFSIVRFGNVLGSSGSVVPLFKKQISNGGPITLTHPDVTRYFMSIKEAAQLVIQSSSLAIGGEVFLLDMGPSIKIINLAKEMIKLSGLNLKDKENPLGDIEIKVTGLKNGEKLYEELLIENDSSKTSHPLIYKAKEKFIPEKELRILIEELKDSIEALDKIKCWKILKKLVPEWKTLNEN